MLSFFELSAVLLTLSAVLGWVNHKYLPFPHTIGLLIMSVVVSLILVGIDAAVPDRHLFDALTSALLQIDFSAVVMQGMLAFLLFAGALHVDLGRLRSRAVPVIVLATFGTAVSTLIVGVAVWQAAALLGQPLTLAWAMVFGALISPTDPVAVLSTLKNINVPPRLEVEMQGESLFNDGIGIVLFTILLLFATGGAGERTTIVAVGELLLVEAGGGLLLGIVTGYLAYRAMRLIDDYAIEVLISLALVTATYAVAQRLHVSGPLAVVAAGLLIGHRGPQDAMSDQTQSYVFGLWTLIDEILNSVLFLLIGLEVLILRFHAERLGHRGCCNSHRPCRPIHCRGPPRARFVVEPDDGHSQRAVSCVGRYPGRHFRGARSVRARQPCQTCNSGGNLRGRPFQHHRAGIDAWLCRKADGVAGGSGRSQKLLTADHFEFCDDDIATR